MQERAVILRKKKKNVDSKFNFDFFPPRVCVCHSRQERCEIQIFYGALKRRKPHFRLVCIEISGERIRPCSSDARVNILFVYRFKSVLTSNDLYQHTDHSVDCVDRPAFMLRLLYSFPCKPHLNHRSNSFKGVQVCIILLY